MRLRKRLLKAVLVQRALAKIVAWYIRFCYRTTRWHIEKKFILDTYVAEKKSALYVFWHGRMLMMPCLFPYPDSMDVVVSNHRDGTLIGHVLHSFNLHILWGSTNRRGSKVLREILRSLKKGRNVTVTPDGPRGPRMYVNSHVATIASWAQVPIIPVAFSTSQGFVHHGWDRCMIPVPFDKGVIIYGDPINVPLEISGDDLLHYKKIVEQRLRQITHQADTLVGRTPILPSS